MTDHLLPALAPLLSRVRRDVHAVRTKQGRILRTDARLSDVKVLGHLSGHGSNVGTYHVMPGDSRTRVAVFDFDDHVKPAAAGSKGSEGSEAALPAGLGWAKVCAAAKSVWDEALRLGWEGQVFRSGGGRGIHIFFIWDQPQDCYSVRQAMGAMLEACGLRPGTGGLVVNQVEVFPKQDRVVEGAFGSQFWLPLGRASVPLCTDEMLGWGEPLSRDAALLLDWRVSPAVAVKVKLPVRRDGATGATGWGEWGRTDDAAMRSLISQVQCIGFDAAGGDDYTYDRWLQVAFALHHATGGSEEGFELWRSWSSKGSNAADDETLRTKWDSIRHDKGDQMITAKTLEFLARAGGWSEDVSAYFETLPVVAEGVGGSSYSGAIIDASDTGPVIFVDGSAWMDIGRKVYSSLFWHDDAHGGCGTLWYASGVWWWWDGKCYSACKQGFVDAKVRLFLDRCYKLPKDNKGQVNRKLAPVPFNPSMKSMAEVMKVLETLCYRPTIEDAAYGRGSWLDAGSRRRYLGEGRGEGSCGSGSAMLVCLDDGLLHVGTRRLLPHTPAYFCTNVVPFRYEDGAAMKGEAWLKFVSDVFDGDAESISTLQEMFGLLLVPDTSFQKMFVIIGKRRTGKGTLGRILTALLGEDNVISTGMDVLSNQFGLTALLGKMLAVMPDARNGAASSFGQNANVAVQRVLSITGEDSMSVQRKYMPDWSGPLGVRFLLMSNEIPSVADDSDAFVGRCLVFRTGQSFFGREDRQLTQKLLAELPFILRWALDGLDRLYARGRFIQPERGQEMLDKIRDRSNPLQAFIKDRCVVDPIVDTPVQEFYEHYRRYVNLMGFRKPKSYGQWLDSIVEYSEAENLGLSFQIGRSQGQNKQPIIIGIACKVCE